MLLYKLIRRYFYEQKRRIRKRHHRYTDFTFDFLCTRNNCHFAHLTPRLNPPSFRNSPNQLPIAFLGVLCFCRLVFRKPSFMQQARKATPHLTRNIRFILDYSLHCRHASLWQIHPGIAIFPHHSILYLRLASRSNFICFTQTSKKAKTQTLVQKTQVRRCFLGRIRFWLAVFRL